MQLPKDLSLYRKKRILIRLIPCVALLCVFSAILFLWGDILINTDVIEFKVSCYIIIMLIPFAITGVPYNLIDSTYCGRITKIDVVTTTDNDCSFKPTMEHLYLKNTIYLHIEKSNGKTVCKKAYIGKAKLQQNLDTYKVGDTVFHLYGTKYVILLPQSANITVNCPVCGCSNSVEDNKCRKCNHSLIKCL